MKNTNWKIIMCYIVIFCYIVFGNAMTFNLGNRLPVKIAELLSIFLIAILLINKRFKFKLSKINFKLLIWILIGFVSLIINTIRYDYSFSDTLYASFYGIRILHLMLLCSLIKDCFCEYKVDITKIFNFIINCYLIVCIIGFIQLIFFPKAYDFYNLFYKINVYFPNADPHVERLISTYFDPNFLAACLLIPVILCLKLWDKYRNKKYLIKFIIFSLTIVLTVSRSGLLGYLVVILLYFIFSIKIENRKMLINKKLIIIFLGFILLLGTAFLSGKIRVFNRIINSASEQSTYYRIDSWNYSMEVVKDNPIFGIGYNAIGTYSENNMDLVRGEAVKYGVDSSILLVLMTTGIVGFVYFTYIIIKYIYSYIRKKDCIYKIGIMILISALICCNFNNLLFYILWLFPFLLIVNFMEDDVIENRD